MRAELTRPLLFFVLVPPRVISSLAASQDIYKRLFRVYAIIYHRHFGQIEAIGAASHTNTSLKHFAFFAFEFNLLDEKELPALKGPIDRLREEFKSQKAGRSSVGPGLPPESLAPLVVVHLPPSLPFCLSLPRHKSILSVASSQ